MSQTVSDRAERAPSGLMPAGTLLPAHQVTPILEQPRWRRVMGFLDRAKDAADAARDKVEDVVAAVVDKV